MTKWIILAVIALAATMSGCRPEQGNSRVSSRVSVPRERFIDAQDKISRLAEIKPAPRFREVIEVHYCETGKHIRGSWKGIDVNVFYESPTLYEIGDQVLVDGYATLIDEGTGEGRIFVTGQPKVSLVNKHGVCAVDD